MDELDLLDSQTENVVKRLREAVLDASNKLEKLNFNQISYLGSQASGMQKKHDVLPNVENISPISSYRANITRHIKNHQLNTDVEVEQHQPSYRTSTPYVDFKDKNNYESNSTTIDELMAELKDERKHNQQLQDKISKLEEELGAMQVNCEMKSLSHEQDNHDLLKCGDVLQQIYEAQREREAVMLERIKAANHDRDEALLRAKALMEASHRKISTAISGDASSNMNISNLLGMIENAKTPESIQKFSAMLVQHIQEKKDVQLKQTAQEIKYLMEEKDGAVHKNKKLEAEIKKYKLLEVNQKNSSKNESLQIELSRASEERDASFEKLKTLEEEVETLRVYYNVNKTLAISQDHELVEKYNNYLTSVRQEAAKRIEESKKISQENKKLHESLKHVTLERNSFAIQNQKMTTELNEAYTKCKSLERLVNVLRKKLLAKSQSFEPHDTTLQ